MDQKEIYTKLKYKTKKVHDEISPEKRREMMDLADEYRDFLDAGKTERECVKIAIEMAEKNGFVPFSEKESLKPGDRVYFTNRKKNIILAVIGEEDIENGRTVPAKKVFDELRTEYGY